MSHWVPGGAGRGFPANPARKWPVSWDPCLWTPEARGCVGSPSPAHPGDMWTSAWSCLLSRCWILMPRKPLSRNRQHSPGTGACPARTRPASLQGRPGHLTGASTPGTALPRTPEGSLSDPSLSSPRLPASVTHRHPPSLSHK